MKKLMIGLTLCMSITSYAQVTELENLAIANLAEIEIAKRHKHINSESDQLQMIEVVEEKEVEVGDLSILEASITSTDDLSKMFKQVKKYKYDQDVETVWKVMGSTTPREAFDGPKVHFGKAYVPSESQFYTREDKDVPVFEAGMSVINYLTLPLGLRLAVAVKVVRVDKEKRELEIAYAQGNKSTGVQILSFAEKNGKTVVTHTSYFRSQSWLRDKLAYKPFHSMTVGEFHKTMKRILNKKHPIKK